MNIFKDFEKFQKDIQRIFCDLQRAFQDILKVFPRNARKLLGRSSWIFKKPLKRSSKVFKDLFKIFPEFPDFSEDL